jgi:hypothetical protein
VGGGGRGRSLVYRSDLRDPLSKAHTLQFAQLHNPRLLNIFAALERGMSNRCSLLVRLQHGIESL